MSRSLKIYQGEDETPVVDVTEPSSDVHVIWEEVEAGGRAYRGESNLGSFPMRDERGETGSELNLPAELTRVSLSAGSRIEWLVTDSSAQSHRLFRGRIGPKDYSRGRQKADRAREVVVSANDTNYDLRNIIVDGWSRPEETDVTRVQALITTYLSGSPRASTVISNDYVATGSNTVTLGAKVYDATSPAEVLSEIATIADKLHFVTVDDELFYDGYDSTAYVAGIRISDRLDEMNTIGPCTGQGAGSGVASPVEDPDALLDHPSIATPNGGFEDGDTSSWKSGIGLIGPMATGMGHAGFPAEGNYWGGSGTSGVLDAWPHQYQGWLGKTFQAGETYTVLFYCATSAGWNNIFFGDMTPDIYPGQGPAPSSSGDYVHAVISDDGWHALSWTPSANRTSVLFTQTISAHGSINIDGVRLVEQESLPPLTFPPIWDVGPSSTEDGMELLSGLRLYYGQGSNTYVYVNDPVTANQYWHSEQSLYTNDPLINTAAKATTLAQAILQHRKFEQRTYNVSIGPLTEDQVGCLKPGQLIDIKARAIPDADDQFVSRRIAQLRWTTPVPGTYFAHMMLDRPMKDAPSGIGPKQATDSINRHVEQGSNSHPEYVLRGTLTTQGDLPYRGASDWTRLPIGSSNTHLISDGITPKWVANTGGGSGPDLSAINFLVGTASGDLSNEIVVGTTPGGELGGTWASPTVDAVHSGSAHATQASDLTTRWIPLTVYDPGTGNYLPLVDGDGNQLMAEAS